MISKFDISKLSKDGYRVLIDDMDIKLPSGEVVHNGTQFRNTFHLRPGAYDVFVPCGGRPESVDLSTVGRLIEDKKSTIPYFVEGANVRHSSLPSQPTNIAKKLLAVYDTRRSTST